jgi:hypothetical protein
MSSDIDFGLHSEPLDGALRNAWPSRTLFRKLSGAPQMSLSLYYNYFFSLLSSFKIKEERR